MPLKIHHCGARRLPSHLFFCRLRGAHKGKKHGVDSQAFRVVQKKRGVDAGKFFLDAGEFLLVQKSRGVDDEAFLHDDGRFLHDDEEFLHDDEEFFHDDERFLHDDGEFLLVQKSSGMAFIRR